MKNLKLLIIILIAFSCREKYVPPQVAPAAGYLVVEGNINGGNTPTLIVLSRTNSLSETGRIFEEGAIVKIEGSDNSSFNLPETVPGSYSTSSLNLDVNQTYRLHILTRSGKEYLSSFVQVKQTPVIDSITWVKESGGVRIYVNAHDDAAKTRYYLWNYEETWEFHSPYLSILAYNDKNPNRPFLRYIDSNTFSAVNDIRICWNSRNSTSLLLGSTAKLLQDKVYLPITFIPNGVRDLDVLYSIKVNQFALSKESYEYLEKMRKNTESTGSIFDPQPSALRGNINAVNDPGEIVIGFVNVSSAQEKRKFIYSHELNGWNYNSGCERYVFDNKPDSVKKAYDMGLYPTDILESNGPEIIKFHVTRSQSCYDCTLSGTNVKPGFWP